ncbi:predicted protein [Sclerotinia sclerotiorum 1980 UF-70]|uniref:Uncharacterized protein n=1 Tax=Sclerotinia sclerotiorum (strain ATCC 18683 / 1980 / Ss-1) TaxID=665079 RepID=A7F2J4_SCLS1|nr:predicted protein [Sclerotinia sclerotiorum 1980 UF-70]EDN95936.1 predicted protein [Sclerotinia sclerotiorum 1980 UF-70]
MLRSNVDSLEKQYAKARRMTALLYNKIIQSSGILSDHISIQDQYEKIIIEISWFVSSFLNTAPKGRPKEQHQRRQRDVSLSRIWDENLGDHEKECRCMAAIFEFLNDEIVLKPAFGLEDENDGAIEKGLAEFEKKLQACPEESLGFVLKNN